MAKKVLIKSFEVAMEVKTNGVEFAVKDGDSQIGDFYVTKTGVIWCKGNTTRANGVRKSWDQIISLLEAE